MIRKSEKSSKERKNMEKEVPWQEKQQVKDKHKNPKFGNKLDVYKEQ